ncbi:PREDICTED: zinc finger protein 862-like [Priapulus caudatus]|uniref:Zinc finger protein 862-like n=1 Tax=Priapulus caudatus TaxID=37621 RepID=A0ABM1E549_PRICU|nr:PREDICTED: zinc finger protein 862-like [Priapulus caudatus]
MRKQAEEAYRKLLQTAYIMACDGLPLSHFTTLVKVQRASGVNLIQGCDDSNKAREFVSFLADGIRDKLALIMASATAYSTLTDGSMARKTSSEKELVFVRLVRGGIPLYYCVALQDLSEYGDSTAENIKKAIDDAFIHKLNIPEASYVNCMSASTADGAAVNTGVYNGVLTRLSEERGWLITIHCVLHRLELSMKDVLKQQKKFVEVNDFMITLFYLFKQSGKIKRSFEDTAKALGLQVYKFPKVHGTRFVSHQRRGLDRLLKNWIVLGQTCENMIATGEVTRNYTYSPKLKGVLKRLQDCEFLAVAVLYKEVLDIVSKLSLKLQMSNLMVFDVQSEIERGISSLDTLTESLSGDALVALGLNDLLLYSSSNFSLIEEWDAPAQDIAVETGGRTRPVREATLVAPRAASPIETGNRDACSQWDDEDQVPLARLRSLPEQHDDELVDNRADGGGADAPDRYESQ